MVNQSTPLRNPELRKWQKAVRQEAAISELINFS